MQHTYSCEMFVIFQYAVENEELTQHLGAAKDAQRALTAEVTCTHTMYHISTSIFANCNSPKTVPFNI